jgi:3-oxoacyl-[acyl-carrier protein] reductase
MELKKEEKHIIVTGGSRGIGRAVALRYAECGWNVSVCSHNSSGQLLEVKAAVEDMGGRCFVFEGDMGNPKDVEDFFKGAVDAFGVPDILVNNAGMSHIGLLQDMTNEEWNRLLATNLSSVFYSCRAVIPLFLSVQRGCIINISSVWGNVGASMEVAYSATKGGVNAFTKALARELAPSNIPVNAIACGIIDTEMNRFLSAEERDDILSQIPSGKMGSPQEVALLVEKLAEAPAYMTGQIVTLDGGWT